MSLRHILIVDDDPALLQALPEALHLRIEGLAIDTADSGQAALERINERDYDAIISDIKMPGMDGLALLRTIRERRPETPTLLITGHGEHDLAVQALRAGAYDFIQKPIDRDYFVASLKRAIQVHQLKRQVEEQRLALERHASSLEETVQERTHKLLEANAAKDELLGRVEGLAELLRQRALELDTIIESMADGVYVCDASGQVIRVNKSVTTLFGVTVEQAMAGNNPDAFRTLDGAPLPHEDYPLVQALRGVTRTDYRLMIRRADTGEDRQVRISAAPIRSSTGEIIGAVAVASDITQVYQLERQKDDFLSIASHELKTPLTTMKVLTQLTQRQLERAGAPGSSHMARMAQAITRMEQLINDLLDASRIQAGKLAINLEPCALQPLCKQVADDQMAATGRVIRLLAPEEPLVIEADVDRLSQVLTNLLSNALKYSPTTCPVTLTLAYTEEAIILSVRDEGPGIPAEALPHIFDRFYRAPGIEVQSGSGVGLGLGLHICREIVERHGGNIWAESTLGSGSVFYVALPVVPVLSQPAGFSGPEGAADRKRSGFSQER